MTAPICIGHGAPNVHCDICRPEPLTCCAERDRLKEELAELRQRHQTARDDGDHYAAEHAAALAEADRLKAQLVNAEANSEVRFVALREAKAQNDILEERLADAERRAENYRRALLWLEGRCEREAPDAAEYARAALAASGGAK